MNEATIHLAQHRQHCEALIAAHQSALLATASADGTPLNSYAPIVRNPDGVFYVFISELAEHTRHLLENPRASLMFIRSESESKNLFARERVVLACSVERIERDRAIFEQQMHAMTERFGETMTLLKSLADFHLFALTVVHGTYVVGFGQAFQIDPQSGDLTHIQATKKGK